MSDNHQTLKNAGLRVTKPRLMLLEAMDGADRPLSAEEMHERMPEGGPDLVTIYRNMATFLEKGIAQALPLENGKQLYEVGCVHSGHHHHHIICRICHKTVCMHLCFGAELEKLASEAGFTDLAHKIEVYGMCAECSAKN